MHVLAQGTWIEGFLDHTPAADLPRVEVHRQVALVPAADQYFVREPQLAMLISYVQVLGVRRVVRKVLSRRNESVRNDAWLSIGIGRLVPAEATPGDGDGVAGGRTGPRPEGDVVAFVLPSGPQGLERTVVPAALVRPLPDHQLTGAPAHFVPAAGAEPAAGLPGPARGELVDLAGWNPEEGTDPVVSSATWDAVVDLVAHPARAGYEPAPARPPASPPRERSRPVDAPAPAPAADPAAAGRPGLTVFGYGQYAKTQVIANLGERLRLDCVHEVNPLQIGPVTGTEGPVRDTSPRPRPGEVIEHAAVASYHHTHAPLAVELLDRGVRHVVVEKPLATTTRQLDDLVSALARNPGARIHTAFQRRFSPFNAHLREDLGGGPISMSATVYEVPLPARHWYRWPVVGNAVVSNGCHWIDHFLHLNDYAEPTHVRADALGTQTVLDLVLANGASCSISLRHEGAPRRGVRDLCTFWHGEATAVIEDARRYRAERGYRVVRRATCHPYRSHEDMYREFGRRIEVDAPGDDVRALRVSTTTVLELARLAGSTR